MVETTRSDRPATRAEEIRQLLADEIVRGRLAPGVALDETEIARKYRVSRTPVREAIRQLEATGLAEARPRRGAVVAAVTRERLDQMFFMMLELEALCARESALRMTLAEREALKALHDRGAEPVQLKDVTGYIGHNLAFHDAVYGGAHNGYLREMTSGVRKRLAPFRRVQFWGMGRLAASQAEHGEVVAAILAGDAERAAEAMRAHIQVVRQAYVTLVPEYGVA